MKTVHVNTGNPYDVTIGGGLMAQVGTWLAQRTPSRTAALVMDDTVAALYGEPVAEALQAQGFNVCRFAFAPGEHSKTLLTYGRLLGFLAENHITRTDTVVALGGGVTGDLAGFAAATYLRGMPVTQIPTTLLAMVDSSVGGKTGVDLPAGKNLVGAFHQPIGVLCDPDALTSLPPETFADGMAEVIKYGVLCDAPLFDSLSAGTLTPAALEAVIERCVHIKADVCAEDERDVGRRQLLNLGHTFGHAIERLSGYACSHGHAVAVGMVYAARIAVRLGICPAECVSRLTAALTNHALPTAAPYSAAELAQAALGDKKRLGGNLTLVLPRGIGECELHPVRVAELETLATYALEA